MKGAVNMKFDMVLSGGWVVDPANGFEGTADVGIAEGSVAQVAPELDPGKSAVVHDVSGLVVMPGVVDMHVHTSRRHKGHNAHRMMAKAGVVTALDMGGPLDEFFEFSKHNSAGLNLAGLQQVRPGHTVAGDDPGEGEIRGLLEQSIEEGAVGLKLLGGHYPMTPEATRSVIEVCNAQRRYVAFHSGTTRTPGDLEGFVESVELAGELRLHIPHINSYCRGVQGSPLAETAEALSVLKGRPNLFTESYLATINGTSGRCIDGVPESQATQRCLMERGYEPTAGGLQEAIRDGYARVTREYGAENINVTGEEAVEAWLAEETVVSVNFPVNSAVSRFLCAVSRDENDRFIVDAISTDGGGHPRNVAVEHGLALVRAEGLTLSELVQKISWAPATILGLPAKGHLGVGADADLTVVDLERCNAVMSFNAGNLIMYRGAVMGSGTTIITSEAGERAVQKRGLDTYVARLEDGIFYGEGRPF